MPSEWVSQDISIPLPSRSADIYPHPFPAGWLRYIICLQNRSAGIYPPPFRMGQPGYIICLQNRSASIYPPPFTVGQPRYITCLHNGWAHRLGTGYTSPLTTHQPLISILENYYS